MASGKEGVEISPQRPDDGPTPVLRDESGTDRIGQVHALDDIINSARIATEKEQNMTLMQGIRLYPKAIAWSVLISTCIVMEGYDVALINNFCK